MRHSRVGRLRGTGGAPMGVMAMALVAVAAGFPCGVHAAAAPRFTAAEVAPDGTPVHTATVTYAANDVSPEVQLFRDVQPATVCEKTCVGQAMKTGAVFASYRAHPATDPITAAHELCERYGLPQCPPDVVQRVIQHHRNHMHPTRHSILADMTVRVQFFMPKLHDTVAALLSPALVSDVVLPLDRVVATRAALPTEPCAALQQLDALPAVDGAGGHPQPSVGVCAMLLEALQQRQQHVLNSAAQVCGRSCRWWERLPDGLGTLVNHGRQVVKADGMFALPDGVHTVVIDVGSHRLEHSRHTLRHHPDVAVVAIEPVWELVASWPPSPRLIAVPAAVDLQPGLQYLNVHVFDETSSLSQVLPEYAESLKNVTTASGGTLDTWYAPAARRPVPVVTLADVLGSIPGNVSVASLKVDAQGRDLRVLRSAGSLLQRVRHVVVESSVTAHYEGESPMNGSEAGIRDFMARESFVLQPVDESDRNPLTGEIDLVFVNEALV